MSNHCVEGGDGASRRLESGAVQHGALALLQQGEGDALAEHVGPVVPRHVRRGQLDVLQTEEYT